MTSLFGGRLGVQVPRVMSRPAGIVGSSGPDAVTLAKACGRELDDWQAGWLDLSLAERADGSWAASEVGGIVSRQNGKNEAVEARECFGLTVLNEWIIHTSHHFKTTLESYNRLLEMIQAQPDVERLLVHKAASPASGYHLKFRGGGRITFIARSRASGRGLTGDLLIFDEAQILADEAQAALLPTISARPGAQSWYFGSAPTFDSTVFHRLRQRGRAGDPRLAYIEHSADPDADLDDRAAWAQANPALGYRITEEAVESERAAMSDDTFACERLSISPDLTESSVFPGTAWADVCDPAVEVTAKVFAFDVNPEHSAAAIVAVGDGPSVELVDYRPGIGWLIPRVAELSEKYGIAFAVHSTGPAGSMVDELKRSHVDLAEFTTADLPAASALFFDAVGERRMRVRTRPEFDTAVLGAVKRSVGDAWAWDRKNSRFDICPLVAATLGYSAFLNRPPAEVAVWFA